MKQKGRIILASASPRRRDFLVSLGLDIEVVPSEVAEVGYGGDPALLPMRITRQKVKAVRARLGANFEGWIVGADTVVALGHETFGKPRDAEDAKQILKRLSGRTHDVYTGFRVERSDGDFREQTVRTSVEIAELQDGDIDWYVATGEPMDKAGAYAIQERGGLFVKTIQGSYSNVVGLPLYEVIHALRELEAI